MTSYVLIHLNKMG